MVRPFRHTERKIVMNIGQLQATIDAAWRPRRHLRRTRALCRRVEAALTALDNGELRVAAKEGGAGRSGNG